MNRLAILSTLVKIRSRPPVLLQITHRMASIGKRKAAVDVRVGNVSPPPTKKTIASTTTKSSVKSFFTPTSKKAAPAITWKIIGKSLITGVFQPSDDNQTTTSVSTSTSKQQVIIEERPDTEDEKAEKITAEESEENTTTTTTTTTTLTKITSPEPTDIIRIAAFDLDSTLIRTSSGNKFAKDESDWQWWHTSVPDKIRQMYTDGFRIVLFTNQNGIKLASSKSEKRYNAFKTKVSNLCTILGVPVNIYGATEVDQFRKPRTAMFEHFLEDLDGEAWKFDVGKSIFVGDAAGRDGDHSAGDRQFALNIGIPFVTPEEFFFNEPPKPYKFDLNISQFIDNSLPSDPQTFSRLQSLELVIFVGSPGSGKSTFYRNVLEPQGYERVNQDMLKTREKCLKVAKEHLEGGKSVAVDNTNAEPLVRSAWRDVATKYSAAFRCILFTTPAILCRHNDGVRAYAPSSISMNPENRTALPGLAFGGFVSRYKEPQLAEGFVDITRVDFKFRGTDTQKEIWSKFW